MSKLLIMIFLESAIVPVLQFSLVNRANYHNTYPRCRLVFKDLDGVELSDVEFHSKGFSMNHREYEGMPVGIPVEFLVPLEEPPIKAVNYELFLM